MSEPSLTPESLAAHDRFLRSLARALVVDPSLADDLAQETWLTALERVPRDGRSLQAWLSKIARNLAFHVQRGQQRRAHREKEAAKPALVPSVEEILDREVARRSLVEAVLALEDPYRDVLLLRYFQDLAPRVIARRLGVPVETVRTRIKRGLSMLRARLEREQGGDRTAGCLALVRTLQTEPGVRVPLLTPSLKPAVAQGFVPSVANTMVQVVATIALCLVLLLLRIRAASPHADATAPPVAQLPTSSAEPLLSELRDAAGSRFRAAIEPAVSASITSIHPDRSPRGDLPPMCDNMMKLFTPVPAALALVLSAAPSSAGVAVQQSYLKASNTDPNDRFGTSVAISGDTLVVGAGSEASSATGVNGNQADNSLLAAGAAYVFVWNGTSWAQQAYLKASNTGLADGFGKAVAISGDTIVIGATGENSNATGVNGNELDSSLGGAGAAYVFVRSGTTWTQQAYLKASNTDGQDNFGFTVAISGDTIVVGATGEASNATGVNGNQSDNSILQAGAAYVFVRSGTTWSQEAYLKASNTEADTFGNSVTVSGDTIVVGAVLEDSNATGVNGNESDNSAVNAGAAYVFVRSGTSWSQQAYLKASNTETGDFFGTPVSLSGDTLLVGAAFEDSGATGANGNESDNSVSNSGAAYVFVRSGTTWTQQAYLKASNPDANDRFGTVGAISGDTLVLGTNNEDSNATGVNGNPFDNSATTSGAAYEFVRNATIWSQHAYLKASNTAANDSFAICVAVSGSTIVSGAYAEDSNATGVNGNESDNSASNSGAVYVFNDPPPGVLFCVPGAGGVTPCACGNPNGADLGCANTGSSGASLASSGVANLGLDATDPGTVVLSATSMLSGSTCIFLQGDALVTPGALFGAGIRCTGGNLFRLKVAVIGGGAATYPAAGDRSITNRSTDLGTSIGSGQTRWYQAYYRDPTLANPGSGCPTNATFNATSGQQIAWGP